MPWIHLHVSNKGQVNACCVSQIRYGNINSDSLEAIWKGEDIEKIRHQFKNQEHDNRCANCINIEQAGGKSIRQETHDKYKDVNIKESTGPIYFDIRFSNVCNFRCRTCWHGASSKWFTEAKLLGSNVAKQAIIKNVNDFDNFISKTGQALLGAQEIYFAGGEPLVTEEHYMLLEYLVKHGATNMLLRYNTNFSNLTFKNWDVLDLWSKFNRVEVHASIDASHDLGEYIRKDMKWNEIVRNRELIRDHKHIEFFIAPTISVLNILQLPNLYMDSVSKEFIEPEKLYVNLLDRPFHYNIQILPPSYKKNVQQEFEKVYEFIEARNIDISIKQKFEEIINYMLAKDESRHWAKFISETDRLDDLRKEDYRKFLEFE